MFCILCEFIGVRVNVFVDDMGIMGMKVSDVRVEDITKDGVRLVVKMHIDECEEILAAIEDAGIPISGAKSYFGVHKIDIDGHVCNAQGRQPEKIRGQLIVD
ncbi:hypothetical protein HK104_007997 [Borealophlyctis nickersoniae]|nr:hypothetical protein HK104_007997 [Borealophlyctis nickersoniae]